MYEILTYLIDLKTLEQYIYIYEDSKLVNASSFTSYAAAHKALGLKSSSNTCSRYIDTYRLYKSKYLFTSKPVDITSEVK